MLIRAKIYQIKPEIIQIKQTELMLQINQEIVQK
jgi:hypothetical protein